ncbi:hypothetical protein BUE65_21475, partial [Klebsiella variicola]
MQEDRQLNYSSMTLARRLFLRVSVGMVDATSSGLYIVRHGIRCGRYITLGRDADRRPRSGASYDGSVHAPAVGE